MSVRNFLRAIRTAGGASAVEFALIAPLLVAVLLGLADAVNFAVEYTSMQRAERAGIQYFMNGGTSTAAAQGIVSTAWTNPPSGYTVTAAQVCTCGGNSHLIVCGLSCSSGQLFAKNMQITASATVRGMLTSLSESKSETVRVQ